MDAYGMKGNHLAPSLVSAGMHIPIHLSKCLERALCKSTKCIDKIEKSLLLHFSIFASHDNLKAWLESIFSPLISMVHRTALLMAVKSRMPDRPCRLGEIQF